MLPHLNDFLKKLKDAQYSPETIYNYERDLNTFSHYLTDHVGVNFNDINSTTLEDFKKYLLSSNRLTSTKNSTLQKLSTSSINRVFSSIKSYSKYLLDNDIKAPINYTSVKLSKNKKKHVAVPGLSILLQLIEAPDKFESDEIVRLRNRAMLETIFATGLSISELLSLKIENMDENGHVYVASKGKKQRFVDINPEVMSHVKNYLAKRVDNSPFMFVPCRGKNNTQKNKKISTNYLQFKIKKYRELLGIDIVVSANSFRYGFFAHLTESNINPTAINKIFSHYSIDEL